MNKRRQKTLKTDYKNDGSSFKLHANSHEVILYDKLKDLEKGKKSDKRAHENDNRVQRLLLRDDFILPFGVLRLEVRIGNRKKLKSLLAGLKIERDMIFSHLFDVSVAKAVLLHYWQHMVPDMPLLAASQFRAEDVYDDIKRSHPEMKPAKILQ